VEARGAVARGDAERCAAERRVVGALRRRPPRCPADAGARAEPDACTRQRTPRPGTRRRRCHHGGPAAEREHRRARVAPAHLGEPAAQQLRVAELRDGAGRRDAVARGQLRVRPRRPRAAHRRGRACQRRAGRGRFREHAAPPRHRSRDRVLQPARDRHRDRRRCPIARAAGALARVRAHAPRPRRRLRPRPRAAAGAARHHPQPARPCCAASAGRSSTRSRR
jgi:hypothetical protein